MTARDSPKAIHVLGPVVEQDKPVHHGGERPACSPCEEGERHSDSTHCTARERQRLCQGAVSCSPPIGHVATGKGAEAGATDRASVGAVRERGLSQYERKGLRSARRRALHHWWTTLHEADDQDHDRDEQQEMDKASQGIGCHQSQEPQHQQDHEERPQHVRLLSSPCAPGTEHRSIKQKDQKPQGHFE